MLEIPLKTQDKLRRYLVNADPFLWGTLKSKNKKDRLKELQDMEYLKGYTKGSNPIYSRINNDLILELGITGILEHIIIKRIRDLFTPDQLAYLRRCWEQGQTPPLDYFKKQGLYKPNILVDDEVREGWDNRPSGYRQPAYIFVQIHSQFGFVERWTVFAGLWFEEIEPLLE
jgi:hypothetical protein